MINKIFFHEVDDVIAKQDSHFCTLNLSHLRMELWIKIWAVRPKRQFVFIFVTFPKTKKDLVVLSWQCCLFCLLKSQYDKKRGSQIWLSQPLIPVLLSHDNFKQVRGSDSQIRLPLLRRQNKQHCRNNTTKSFLVMGKI